MYISLSSGTRSNWMRSTTKTLLLHLCGVFASAMLLAEEPLPLAEKAASAAAVASQIEPIALRPDPAVLFGRLENGLRYAILPNHSPAKRASICLLVQVGSYQENDDELGYAHFVEHMAFRSTREYPGDKAIKTLQGLGSAFGPHVNARTSFFYTTYGLKNLPTDDREALPTGLRILGSMAEGIIFSQEELQQERGVVLSEARIKGSFLANLRKGQLEFLSPDPAPPHIGELYAEFERSRLLTRTPMGSEKYLRRADAKKLRAFYDRWYRPERMILAVVGDIGPKEIEDLIIRTFSPLKARGVRPAEVVIEDPFLLIRKEKPAVYIGQVLTATVVEVNLSALSADEADTAQRRRKSYFQGAALTLLDLRLVRAAEQSGSPLLQANTFLSHFVPGLLSASLRATCDPDQWEKTLTAITSELRRACESGFAGEELRFLRGLHQHFYTAQPNVETKQSGDLSTFLAHSTARGLVFTSSETDQQLAAQFIPELTSEQCRLALKELFPTGGLCIGITGDLGKNRPTPDLARKRLKEGLNLVTAPSPLAATTKPFPYTDFGSPGKVVRREHDELLGADVLEFANGIRLNLKRTNFEPGRVFVECRMEGGRLACPSDKPGLDRFLSILLGGGLRDLTTLDEIAAFPSLVSWSGAASIGATEISFERSGSSAGLHSALENSAAHFLYPALRDDDWKRAKQGILDSLAPSQVEAELIADQEMRRRLTGNHPALAPVSPDVVNRRTLDEFKEWYPGQLAAAPLEITIVGDFDPRIATEEVARTFGAFTPRAKTGTSTAIRPPTMRTDRFSETITAESCHEGTAAVTLAWPMMESFSSKDRIHAALLAEIVGDRLRLKLRAQMGETYSPRAEFQELDKFAPSIAYLSCTAEAAPKKATIVAAAARKVIEELLLSGITSNEFERARQPLVKKSESDLRRNSSWLTALRCAQSRRDSAVNWVQAVSVYRAATVEEVNALAQKLLISERRCELIVVPVAPETKATLARARARRAKGDGRGALAALEKLMSLNPGYASTYLERGLCRMELKDTSGALADFDEGIRLSPFEAKIFRERARLKVTTHNFTGALADFDRCLALDPADAEAATERGHLKKAVGDTIPESRSPGSV